MVVAWTYAIAVNFVPKYRDTVDKVGESTVGLQGEVTSKDEEAVLGSAPTEKGEGENAVHVEEQG